VQDPSQPTPKNLSGGQNRFSLNELPAAINVDVRRAQKVHDGRSVRKVKESLKINNLYIKSKLSGKTRKVKEIKMIKRQTAADELDPEITTHAWFLNVEAIHKARQYIDSAPVVRLTTLARYHLTISKL